jgi:Fe-S-cluster containining protein
VSYVPCSGCTACCKSQRVLLEEDENREPYVVEPTVLCNDGSMRWMLAHKPNGDCWYLGDGGCTIHDRTPKACREFDCRKWFARFDPTQQYAISVLDRACADAARRLLGQDKEKRL